MSVMTNPRVSRRMRAFLSLGSESSEVVSVGVLLALCLLTKLIQLSLPGEEVGLPQH